MMSNQLDLVHIPVVFTCSNFLVAALAFAALLLLTPNTAAAALSKYQILILLTNNTAGAALSKYQIQQLYTQNTTVAVASHKYKIRLMLAKILLLL